MRGRLHTGTSVPGRTQAKYCKITKLPYDTTILNSLLGLCLFTFLALCIFVLLSFCLLPLCIFVILSFCLSSNTLKFAVTHSVKGRLELKSCKLSKIASHLQCKCNAISEIRLHFCSFFHKKDFRLQGPKYYSDAPARALSTKIQCIVGIIGTNTNPFLKSWFLVGRKKHHSLTNVPNFCVFSLHMSNVSLLKIENIYWHALVPAAHKFGFSLPSSPLPGMPV